MAKVRDLKTTPPENLTHLTKEAMLSYIIDCGTEEDKNWYVDLCEKNLVTKKNNLTNEEITTPDVSILRKEFAKRFFPNLLEANKPKAKAKSYMDRVRELKAK